MEVVADGAVQLVAEQIPAPPCEHASRSVGQLVIEDPKLSKFQGNIWKYRHRSKGSVSEWVSQLSFPSLHQFNRSIHRHRRLYRMSFCFRLFRFLDDSDLVRSGTRYRPIVSTTSFGGKTPMRRSHPRWHRCCCRWHSSLVFSLRCSSRHRLPRGPYIHRADSTAMLSGRSPYISGSILVEKNEGTARWWIPLDPVAVPVHDGYKVFFPPSTSFMSGPFPGLGDDLYRSAPSWAGICRTTVQ